MKNPNTDTDAVEGAPARENIVDIVADVRERRSETFTALESRADVAMTLATLEFGDYSVAGQVSFERKTADDLGRSIIDGRLFPQMSKLRRLADRPVLLVEGLLPQTTPSGVPWHAVRGAPVTVAVIFGVPVLMTDCPHESAEMIVAAGRQLKRGTSLGYVRPGYRPRGWRRRSLSSCKVYLVSVLHAPKPCSTRLAAPQR